MANRNFNPVQALDKEVKHLYANISIGASGAPTLNAALGIASVARDNAGDYTLTLDDKYNKLLMFKGQILDAASEDIVVQPAVDAVASGPSVSFFTNTAATATDPSNGSTLLIELVLRNSSVGPA